MSTSMNGSSVPNYKSSGSTSLSELITVITFSIEIDNIVLLACITSAISPDLPLLPPLNPHTMVDIDPPLPLLQLLLTDLPEEHCGCLQSPSRYIGMDADPLVDGEVLALLVIRDLEFSAVGADALRVPLLAFEEEAG